MRARAPSRTPSPGPAAPPTGRRRRFAVGVLAAGGVALGVAAATAAIYLGAQSGLSVRAIEDTILSWGAWGVVASIGLMVLHSFVPFPAEFLAIANGMIYGPVWGVVVTWVGAMLGALAAFGLARALGRPFVETVVARRHWDTLDAWTAARGARLLLISRLIPVIAFNLINYAAGLTRIPWWTFTWATGVGIVPMTTLMVLAGDQMEALAWEMWLLLLAAALALWFPLRGLLRATRHRPTRCGGRGDVSRPAPADEPPGG